MENDVVLNAEKLIEEAKIEDDLKTREEEIAKKELFPSRKLGFDFLRLIPRLLQNEAFFAVVSRYIEKKESNSIPTIGVRATSDGYFEMLYNSKFMETLIPQREEDPQAPKDPEYEAIIERIKAMPESEKDKMRLGILKHEYYHIILEHVTGRRPSPEWATLWNYATDLSINTWIPDEIPEHGLVPGRGQFKNMPEKKAAEWYFEKLKQEAEKNGGSGKDGQVIITLDEHGEWGQATDQDGNPVEMDAQLKKIAQDRLRQMMKKATQESASQGWGNMPEHIQRHIMDFIKPPSLDWQGILRSFVRKSQRCEKKSTVRRLDRRMPYIWPGKKTKRQSQIAVSIDQSGSVSDALLCKFFSELNTLTEFATFTVVPFDHEVVENKIFEWKKGMHYKPERVACGGTDFDAPTRWVNDQKKFDAHIVCTDGYAPKPGPSKCQRMWILPINQRDNPTFETNEIRVFVPEENEC